MAQRSYKLRIYPTTPQKRQLAVFFGQVRWVWNYMLALRTDLYQCRGESVNYIKLSQHLTYLKAQESHKWLNECPRAALIQTLIDQDQAFKRFFAGKAKYPKFKKKRHSHSLRVTIDQEQIHTTFVPGELLRIIKLGRVKVRWSRLPTGVPKTITVRQDSVGKYWACFTCEESIKPKAETYQSVGVDVGLADIAVTSDGLHYGAPRYARYYARKLKLAQRSLERKRKDSNRWHKQRKAVARIHAKISNSRKDFLHNLSSRLVTEYDVISLEDINVRGLMRKRNLSLSTSDAGLFELRRQLSYKAAWYGKHLQIIDRWFPSTKLCSQCGQLHEMKLSDRWFSCDCGNEMDRDENAALNIKAEGNRLFLRGA